MGSGSASSGVPFETASATALALVPGSGWQLAAEAAPVLGARGLHALHATVAATNGKRNERTFERYPERALRSISPRKRRGSDAA